MKVLEPPLDVISRDARAYPVHLLREGDTALCLFAAAFLGVNDSVHMARMGMRATCVDINGRKLAEMANLYPDDWNFWVGDAWDFAEAASVRGMVWDVVSVDSFTGTATDRSLDSLSLWCSIADRVVTATVAYGQPYEAPDGWQAVLFPRSVLASWLVLTR